MQIRQMPVLYFVVICLPWLGLGANAKNLNVSGNVEINTIWGDKNFNCNGYPENCAPGKPCFTVITINGPAANHLYELLAQHKDANKELLDSPYLGTKSDGLVCLEEEGEVLCRIGYEFSKNEMESPFFCPVE